MKSIYKTRFYYSVILLTALSLTAAGNSAFSQEQIRGTRILRTESQQGAASDPVLTFDRGIQSYQLLDFESAEQCFSSVCKEHPNSQIFPQASLFWGRTLIKLNREREAMELWDSLYMKKQYLGNRYDLFKLYQQFGVLDQKLERFKKAAAENPSDYQSQSDLVEFLVYLNRIDESVAQYKAMLKANPANFQLNKSIGDLLSRFRRFSEAIKYYEELLNRDPLNEVYLDALANAWFQAGNTRKAMSYWSKIIENTTEWNRYNFLANIYQNHGMVTEAVEIYSACQKKTGNPTLFYTELAELYEIAGDYPNLMSMYFKIIDGSPGLSPAIENRIAETIKRNEDSRVPLCDFVQKTMDEIQKNDEKIRIASLIFLGSRKFENALELYFRQSELSGNPSAVEEFAETLILLGETDLAQKCLLKIAEKYKGTETEYRARFKMATLLMSSGKYKQAYDTFQTVISNNKFSSLYSESLFRMATINLDCYKKIREAILQLKELAGSANPNTENAIYCLTRAYIYSADFQEAEKSIAVVEKFQGGDFPQKAKALSAYVLLYRGTYEAALDVFHELVADNPSVESAHEYLSRMALIRENGDSPETLKKYFNAERLFLAGDFTSAETLISSITSGETSIAKSSALLAANIKFYMGQYDKFIEKSTAIIKTWPESNAAAEARFALGKYYCDIVGDRNLAISQFGEILKKHPQSLLLNKAREYIKKLDGGVNVPKKRETFFNFI